MWLRYRSLTIIFVSYRVAPTVCAGTAFAPGRSHQITPPATTRNFPGEVLVPWLQQTLEHAAAAGVTSITLAEDLVHAFESSGAGSPHLSNLLRFHDEGV